MFPHVPVFIMDPEGIGVDGTERSKTLEVGEVGAVISEALLDPTSLLSAAPNLPMMVSFPQPRLPCERLFYCKGNL